MGAREQAIGIMSTPLGALNPLINSEVFSTLAEEECDPIRILAKIANGEMGADIDHQLSAAKELAQYMHAKKRSIDMRAAVKGNITYNIVQFGQVAPEEAQILRERARASLAKPKTMKEVKALVAEENQKAPSAVVIEAMRESVEVLDVSPDGFAPSRGFQRS
jgi:hypothetical protein